LNRRWRLVALAVVVSIGAACTPRAPLPRLPRRALAGALAAAELEVSAGRYVAADSILADFAATHATSGDTLNVLFWRALYLLDPANPTPGAPASALTLIDRYLAADATQDQRTEAQVLRRVAAFRVAPPPVRRDTVLALDTAALRAAVARETEARDRARDDESRALRDSLARTTAELERIRRRLAPGRP
jgi:hypothetical protein